MLCATTSTPTYLNASKFTAAASVDVHFDGSHSGRTAQGAEREAICWLIASVKAVSFLTLLITLSHLTMDITCCGLSFGCGAISCNNTNGPSVNSHAAAMNKKKKKKPHKIFISSQRSAKVKATACLCSDMKPISVMALSKCHKKQWGAIKRPLLPTGFLINGP